MNSRIFYFPFIFLISSCSLGPPVLWIEDEETYELGSFPHKNKPEIADRAFYGATAIPQVLVVPNHDYHEGSNRVDFCVRVYEQFADIAYEIKDISVSIEGRALSNGVEISNISNHEHHMDSSINYSVNCVLRFEYEELFSLFQEMKLINYGYTLYVLEGNERREKTFQSILEARIVRHPSW